jgi:hypothetical protein|tara:strand:- start:1028 stop:1255 length:228 start_codon:yes stop_codon:yes gene_type:complete
MTSVAFVVDQVSQPTIVIVTVTYSMSVAFVAGQVSQKETVTVSVTYSMRVVYALVIILLVQDVQFLLRVTTMQMR